MFTFYTKRPRADFVLVFLDLFENGGTPERMKKIVLA
jgi:hypothetical protein